MSITYITRQTLATVAVGAMFVSPAMSQDVQFKLQPFVDEPVVGARAGAVGTPWFRVKELRSGWGIDRTIVFLNEPGSPQVGTNPENCPITNYGYVVNETHSGRNLFNTYLLTALMNGREVSLVIHSCYQGFPQVVGVTIK
jgi:hypothetical protein